MMQDIDFNEAEDVVSSEGGSRERRPIKGGIWIEVEGGKAAATIFQSGDLAVSSLVKVIGEDGEARQDAVLFNTVNLPKTNPGVADHTLSDEDKEKRGKACYQLFSAINPDEVPKKMQWSKPGRHFFDPVTGDAVDNTEAKQMNKATQANAVRLAMQTFNSLKNESSASAQSGFVHNPDTVTNGDYLELSGFTGQRYFTKTWQSKKGKTYIGTLQAEIPAGEVACYSEDELFDS